MQEAHTHGGECPCQKMAAMYAGHNWQYHFARWILAIIVVIMVFCLGVQVGEVRGFLGDDFSYGSHVRLSGYSMNPTMMYGSSGASAGTVTTQSGGRYMRVNQGGASLGQ